MRESEKKVRRALSVYNVTILGRRTSVRLEKEMWNALGDIARREGCSVHDLCSMISLSKQPDTTLTAAIRVFLMLYYRAASTEEGHKKAGHGNFSKMIERAKIPDRIVQTYYRKTPSQQPMENIERI